MLADGERDADGLTDRLGLLLGERDAEGLTLALGLTDGETDEEPELRSDAVKLSHVEASAEL